MGSSASRRAIQTTIRKHLGTERCMLEMGPRMLDTIMHNNLLLNNLLPNNYLLLSIIWQLRTMVTSWAMVKCSLSKHRHRHHHSNNNSHRRMLTRAWVRAIAIRS